MSGVTEAIAECQKLSADLKKADAELNYWGSIPKQGYLVEQDQAGDCWRCCIAAILRLPASDVPHFLEEAKKSNHCMDCLSQRWLNQKGYCLVETKKIQFPRYYADGFDGLPVISCGPTERSRGMGKYHAVVTIAGKIVYDPHPSNAGLTAITDEYLVVPLWGKS